MNQILITKSESNGNIEARPELSHNKKKKAWFKFQFAFSLCIIAVSIFCVSIYLYQLNKKEDFADKLLANYNIYRLYSSSRRKFIFQREF